MNVQRRESELKNAGWRMIREMDIQNSRIDKDIQSKDETSNAKKVDGRKKEGGGLRKWSKKG